MTPEESRRDEAARWLVQAGKASLAPLYKEASDLTDYAVLFRYLDAPREPDESEAREALGTAGRVFEEIRALLAPSGKS